MNATRGPAPTLRHLQRSVAERIVARGLDAPSVVAARLELFVRVPPQATTPERLHVYAGGYPARLVEALGETFPAVAHLVGVGRFSALARRYVAAAPPRSYNLNDVGADLPAFLVGDPLAESMPFLADLARLEWVMTRAFHAAAELPAAPNRFAAWTMDDWDAAQLRFQSSTFVVCSPWPIRQLWELRDTPIAEIDLDLTDRPDRVLVYRSGFDVECESVDAGEADALEGLLAGDTLGKVLAGVADRGDDPAAVSGWFARWMALRLIV